MVSKKHIIKRKDKLLFLVHCGYYNLRPKPPVQSKLIFVRQALSTYTCTFFHSIDILLFSY